MCTNQEDHNRLLSIEAKWNHLPHNARIAGDIIFDLRKQMADLRWRHLEERQSDIDAAVKKERERCMKIYEKYCEGDPETWLAYLEMKEGREL